MSIRSRQILSDPGLRAALGPGEQARDYVAVTPMPQGAERDQPVGVASPAPRRESAGREVGGFLAGNWLPRWARGDAVERSFGGVARQGVPGSAGARLHDVLSEVAGLVVSDRRLVAVTVGSRETIDDPERPGRRLRSERYAELWSVPLGDVTAARRRGRLTGRGRVELYFRDASMCAVVAGVLRTEGARRLLDALQVPNEPHWEGR